MLQINEYNIRIIITITNKLLGIIYGYDIQ